MMAILLRCAVLASLLLTVGWWAWCWRSGLGPAWVLGGTLLALLPQAPVLALEFLLLARWGRDGSAPPASAGQLLRAWLGEVWASWWVFGWRQPFRPQQEPDAAPVAGRSAVLLLHGYCCNRGFWSPWLRRLRALGVPAQALTMAPVFGQIDDWVPQIEAAVADLSRRSGRPPLLVAHSMGGLAVRAWLAAQPDAATAHARVLHVVTIGTPHQGTWMARFAHSPNARQMGRGHAWLAALDAGETAVRRAHFTCFYGHADNIVFPAGTATLAGADNRHLAGVAHVAMAFRPEVFDLVLQRLALDGPAAPGR